MSNKIKLVSSVQIYKDTNALLDHILDVVPQFPRVYKYDVGEAMTRIAIDLLDKVAAVYTGHDRELKIATLSEFQHEFITLKTLVRKAGERHWIQSTGRHAQIVDLMDAIGKQSTAWKNSLQNCGEKRAGTGQG